MRPHGNREHIFWLFTSYRAAKKVQNDYLTDDITISVEPIF
jgi:hypothetical protein